jgi:hypothetical protein
MKARKLIESASYDPDTLKVLFQAFDDAWTQVAPTMSNRPGDAIEAARMRLASIILGLARTGTFDPHQLADTAVQRMLAGTSKIRHGDLRRQQAAVPALKWLVE